MCHPVPSGFRTASTGAAWRRGGFCGRPLLLQAELRKGPLQAGPKGCQMPLAATLERNHAGVSSGGPSLFPHLSFPFPHSSAHNPGVRVEWPGVGADMAQSMGKLQALGPAPHTSAETEGGKDLEPQALQDSVLSSLKFRSILIARQLPSAPSSPDAVK